MSPAPADRPRNAFLRLLWPERQAHFVALACLLALLVRIGYVLTLEPRIYWYDGEQYSRIATGMVQHGTYSDANGHPSAFWPPGYPFLLAIVYALFGVNVTAVRVVQALISAGTVALVAGLARRVADRDSARLAALATALYPLFIYTVGAMFPATLLIALVAGSVLLVVVALERDSAAAAAVAGALAGWAGLAAASSFAALLLLAPWMVWNGVPTRAAPGGSRPRALTLAFVYLLPVVLIVGAWTARNQLVLGHPVLISTNGGYNLWLGNYPGIQAATGNRMNLPGMSDEADRIWFHVKGEVSKDRSFSSRGLEYIAADLPRFLRLTLSKARIFWAVYVPPMTVDRPRLGLEKLASMLSYGLLLPFAAAWLIWTVRRSRLSVLVVFLALAYTAVHAVVLAKTRYRLPLDVFVIIYGTAAMMALARALAGRVAGSMGRPARG